MVSRTKLALAGLLVFVFVLSVMATMYTTAAADPIPDGCCILVNKCKPHANVGLGIINEFGNCVADRNPSASGCWPPRDCIIH